MSRKIKKGPCHICGVVGPLSFEHVPPRSAFNDKPVITGNTERLLRGELEELRGPTQQQGSGEYSLCKKCNNDTGAWYGRAYADWAAQGMGALHVLKAGHSGGTRFEIRPLNVLKQIVCMMFSVNAPDLARRNPDLVRFVLNRQLREWNPNFRIYLNYSISPRLRFSGRQAVHRLGIGTSIVSEITYPPFGYLMTHKSAVPSDELVDITFFADALYDEKRDVWIHMPVVNPYTAFPGDYRSKEQVLLEAAEQESNK